MEWRILPMDSVYTRDRAQARMESFIYTSRCLAVGGSIAAGDSVVHAFLFILSSLSISGRMKR